MEKSHCLWARAVMEKSNFFYLHTKTQTHTHTHTQRHRHARKVEKSHSLHTKIHLKVGVGGI